jgi:hypothetical protein
MKQRGIDDAALETLLDYGRAEHQRDGSSIVFLDKRARHRLERDLGQDALKRLGKRLAAYAILARDGAVVTVGHRFRRVRR